MQELSLLAWRVAAVKVERLAANPPAGSMLFLLWDYNRSAVRKIGRSSIK